MLLTTLWLEGRMLRDGDEGTADGGTGGGGIRVDGRRDADATALGGRGIELISGMAALGYSCIGRWSVFRARLQVVELELLPLPSSLFDSTPFVGSLGFSKSRTAHCRNTGASRRVGQEKVNRKLKQPGMCSPVCGTTSARSQNKDAQWHDNWPFMRAAVS